MGLPFTSIITTYIISDCIGLYYVVVDRFSLRFYTLFHQLPTILSRTLEGATFTRATANEADFTGAIGAAHMIRLYAQGSKFDYADLHGSVLDGADLTDCSMKDTKLDKATHSMVRNLQDHIYIR